MAQYLLILTYVGDLPLYWITDTFLLHRSGIETRIQNAVFHLLRNKSNGELINFKSVQAIKQEPLAYMIKIQVKYVEANFNKKVIIPLRIFKSISK